MIDETIVEVVPGFRWKVLYLCYGLNITMFGNIVIFEERQEKRSMKDRVTKIAPLVIVRSLQQRALIPLFF